MNIAQTASDTTEAKATTTTVDVNIAFTKLVDAINSGTIPFQYNGKGRKVAAIPLGEETPYISYSPEAIEVDLNNNLKFVLLASDNSGVTAKWKGILQNSFDLQKVKVKNNTGKYLAIAEGEDSVTIAMKFSFKNVDYAVSWDPRVRVKGR